MSGGSKFAQLARKVERLVDECDLLYFPPDTKGLRTQFRDSALNYIYRTALALSDGRLESASVSVWSTPDEVDSLTLDLTLTVDADWEFIAKLRPEILVKVGRIYGM